jgi:hypothetical protein
MGQEITVHQEVHDHHTRPSAPDVYNGVSTARPMPGSTQAGALPEGGNLAWADQVDRSMQKY